ncbi:MULTISPECIES: hypothetical protein [Nocardia]|uniref:hypothetical protein n=1 Tax=Nocardia TaxID=1817 RepID=UPI0011B20B26|nr:MULTISPECIES: hypothetical protein [Nocardia]
MVDMSEAEERQIREYVNSQSRDDEAELVQKIGSRRMLGRVHDIYDVHCKNSRWWVITDPTNLYSQEDFPQAEQALIFHLGLGLFLTERSRAEMDENEEEHVSPSWRRFRQALETMDTASESEDFQSVGIKCRDALISLAKSNMDADWVGDIENPPKAADFKGWADIFAERLTTERRVRAYVKALVEKTWDLTVWLQHYSNATPRDADLVLNATSHLIGTFGTLIHRLTVGEPERCPRCESYRIEDDLVTDMEKGGFFEASVCAMCGWRSEEVFVSFDDHFEGADIEGYLSGPGMGVSDRLNRKRTQDG